MDKKISTKDNGEVKTLGIISLILAFFVTFAGLIIGIIGVNKAKKFKAETGREADGAAIAQAGFIVSLVFTILGVVAAVVGVIFGLAIAAGTINILDKAIDKICVNGDCDYQINTAETETEDGKCVYQITGENWSAEYNSAKKCSKSTD